MDKVTNKQYEDFKNALIQRCVDKNKTIFLIPTNFHYATDIYGHNKQWADVERGDMMFYMHSDIRDQSSGPSFIAESADAEESMVVKDIYKVDNDIVIEARNGDIYTTIHLSEDLRRALHQKDVAQRLDLVLESAKETNKLWKFSTAALCKELFVDIPKANRSTHLKNIAEVCANYLNEMAQEQGPNITLTESDLAKIGTRISQEVWHQEYLFRDDKLQTMANAYLKKEKPVFLISDMTVTDGNFKFYRFADLKRGSQIEVSCGGKQVTADGINDVDRIFETDTVVSKMREDKGFIIETSNAIYTNIEDFAHKCHNVLHERENPNKELSLEKEQAEMDESAQEYDEPDLSNR